MHQNLRQSQDVVLRGKCVALTTTSIREEEKSRRYGSAGKGVCCQARRSEFEPQDPPGRRGALIPASCPSPSIAVACMPLHTNKSMYKCLKKKRRNERESQDNRLYSSVFRI